MSLFTFSFKSYKRLVILFLYISFFLGMLCFLINSYVDPYMILGKNNIPKIYPSNERRIKATYLKKHKDEFNSVLIGSSRSSYIDVSMFSEKKIFNFSVSGINIDEYLPYLSFFSETQGIPKTIYISLDFHATNKNNTPYAFGDADLIFANSLILQVLEYAKLKVAYNSLKLAFNYLDIRDYYTRDLLKYREDSSGLNKFIIKQTLDYYSSYCLKNYDYSDKYIEHLKEIKYKFPDTNFVVFVSPIHDSLQKHQLVVSGKENYKRWLKDIESIFGNFIDFNDYQDITTSLDNFFDSAHFYPNVSKDIAYHLNLNKA